MKRVLMVCSKLGSGGVEQLYKQWFKYMDLNKINPIFCVFNEGGNSYDFFKSKNISIIRINSIKEIGIYRYIKQFSKIIKEFKINIIHIPSSKTAPLALIGAILAKCEKKILHAHTNDYEFSKKSGFRVRISLYFIRFFNNLLSNIRIAPSKEAGKYCFGEKKDNFILIKNGIDINKYKFSIDIRKKIRKKLGINNSFLLGSVGRLTYQKNQTFLINIVNTIKNKYNKNVKLLLIGEGKDEKKLKEMVIKLDLEKNVIFFGVSNDIASYYQAIDAFVFPSRYEGLGIVAVESQTSGTKTYISEFVPEDAIISDQLKRLTLEDGYEKWAEIIWKNRIGRIDNGVELAKKSGYDESITAKKILDIYMNI